MVQGREKRWKKIHVWVDEDMKKNALQDVDRGEESSLSALIRRLLKEHHEKNLTPCGSSHKAAVI